MHTRQRVGERIAHWGVAICIVTACIAIAVVIALAERGVFTRLSRTGGGLAIPGVTLDDDSVAAGLTDAPMPIVTSLRSDSEAERLGIRVGDHIDAVDGRSVRDVAALREAIVTDRGRGRVALHILHGSAVRTIAIDFAGPAADGRAGADGWHGAQDPAD